MEGGDYACNEASHRVAHHVCFPDFQVIKQTDRIFYHIHSVRIPIMRLVALSVASIVDGDHLESVRKTFDDAGHNPLVLNVDGETVDEQHRLSLAFHDVVDFHSGGVKKEIVGPQEWSR